MISFNALIAAMSLLVLIAFLGDIAKKKVSVTKPAHFGFVMKTLL